MFSRQFDETFHRMANSVPINSPHHSSNGDRFVSHSSISQPWES